MPCVYQFHHPSSIKISNAIKNLPQPLTVAFAFIFQKVKTFFTINALYFKSLVSTNFTTGAFGGGFDGQNCISLRGVTQFGFCPHYQAAGLVFSGLIALPL